MLQHVYECSNCQTKIGAPYTIKAKPIIKCKNCGTAFRRRRDGSLLARVQHNHHALAKATDVRGDEFRTGSALLPSSSALKDETIVFPFSVSHPESKLMNSVRQEDTISLNQNGTRLSDDVDPDKLLVEIVQGLLIAHARLDRMEVTLRQAVERASLEHLKSFDKNLHDIDLRFQRTTADAGKAVALLQEVRADLVRSVQGSSDSHLDAFRKSVSDLQGMLLKLQGTSSSNLTTINSHQTYLAGRLQALLDAQAEVSRLESAKQGENWKNLSLHLKNAQARLDKAFDTVAGDVQIGASTVVDKMEASNADIQKLATLQAKTTRRLLIWLICLSIASLFCLGGILYKLFSR